MKSRTAWIALALVLLAIAVWLAVRRPRHSAVFATAAPSRLTDAGKAEAAPRATMPMPFSPPAQTDATPLRPRSSWRNAGNGTPATALETLFWAKEQSDLLALANVLAMSPETRARATEIFAKMSPLARSQLAVNSPEQLLAFLYANSPFIDGMRVRAEKRDDFQNATITGDLQLAGGRIATIDFHFRIELGGWRYVVDETNARDLLDHWDQYLKGGAR